VYFSFIRKSKAQKEKEEKQKEEELQAQLQKGIYRVLLKKLTYFWHNTVVSELS
jgi:uncharacterized protein (DUF1800 family)